MAQPTIPLFSKREKYSLAFFSVGFIAFSAMIHMLMGSMGYGLMPHFKIEPTPSPTFLIIGAIAKPTPKPTPTPRSTPPPPLKVTPPHLPAIHLPKYPVRPKETIGPVEPPYSPPPTPGVIAPPSPMVNTTPEPIVSATPSAPITIRDSWFAYKAPLEYPPMAIQQNIEGTVIVLVTIGPDGSLLSASIATSSNNQMLDDAALKAARASRYTPYLIDGVPAEQQYKIVYVFSLNP